MTAVLRRPIDVSAENLPALLVLCVPAAELQEVGFRGGRPTQLLDAGCDPALVRTVVHADDELAHVSMSS